MLIRVDQRLAGEPETARTQAVGAKSGGVLDVGPDAVERELSRPTRRRPRSPSARRASPPPQPSRFAGSPRSSAKSSDPNMSPTRRSEAFAMRGASSSAAAPSIDAKMRTVPVRDRRRRARARSSSDASHSIVLGTSAPWARRCRSRPGRTTASRSASRRRRRPHAGCARRSERPRPTIRHRSRTSTISRRAHPSTPAGTPSSRSRIATSSPPDRTRPGPSARWTIRSRCPRHEHERAHRRKSSISTTAASPARAGRRRPAPCCC